MKDRVERVGGIGPERRVRARRETDRGAGALRDDMGGATDAAADPDANLPVAAEPVQRPEEPDPRVRAGGFAAFFAQVLGQPGQRRGLKGGPETLERARATYLETEYSGKADRRPPPGRVTRTDV